MTDDEMRPEYDLAGGGQPNRFARAAVIAALNDAFRLRPWQSERGRWVLTPGALAAFKDDLPYLIACVVTHAEFTDDNDPHREHDFGSFDANGRRLFWKIDYYADATLTAGAEDARTCYRLLTIMLAEEY